MAESFLKEQLKRIREMTEQVKRARDNAAGLSDELAHSREAGRQNPLQEARDLRKYSYPDRETYSYERRPAKAHRVVVHESPRRR